MNKIVFRRMSFNPFKQTAHLILLRPLAYSFGSFCTVEQDLINEEDVLV